MTRCLLLGCSQAKTKAQEVIPAIERYDGPVYRVLRKFLTEYPEQAKELDMFVLSAEFGLIPGSTPVPNYDRRMTRARAEELQPQALRVFQEQIAEGGYQELFISAGKTYLLALKSYKDLLPETISVTVSSAPAGKKLTELKSWLYGVVFEPQGGEREAFQPAFPGEGNKLVQIRGRQIAMSYDEIMNAARQALTEIDGAAFNFRSWYTLVDGQKINTKWLVSLLADLPVSEFAADEARRVLRGLGVPFYKQE
jgi:cytoplasmic iron level regulating protein YaaA (DUF328/UPF0246 family)